VKTTSKFAMFEFRKGDRERGRTIFESLLSSYPKRIDLWNVLIDLEIKSDDIASVRRLFERILVLKLTSRQAKFFFKKWLSFEEERGDEIAVENVKARAVQYVERKGV